MNLPRVQSRRRRAAAFTMVEIALSLAVVAFALVAIIGVLPSGLQVQRDNRQDTLINEDARYLLDALRGGRDALGVLSNAVYFVQVERLSPAPVTTWAWNNTSSNAAERLTGDQIITLLNTPKTAPWIDPRLTNRVTAWLRAINSTAIERDPEAAEVAFRYQLTVEVVPATVFPRGVMNDWDPIAPENRELLLYRNYLDKLHGTYLGPGNVTNASGRLHEVRLTFRWPIWADDPDDPARLRVGRQRRTFRATVAGTFPREIPVGGARVEQPAPSNFVGRTFPAWRLVPGQY